MISPTYPAVHLDFQTRLNLCKASLVLPGRIVYAGWFIVNTLLRRAGEGLSQGNFRFQNKKKGALVGVRRTQGPPTPGSVSIAHEAGVLCSDNAVWAVCVLSPVDGTGEGR